MSLQCEGREALPTSPEFFIVTAMALIQRWNRPEPTLQCLFFRILTPFAGLLDSLIGIFSFTLLHSSFQMWVVEKHMDLHFQYQFKQLEQNKGN